MKMISLLLTLAIIGFVIWKQLGGDATSSAPYQADSAESGSAPPRISSNPEDLPAFESGMDDFMDKQAADRRREIDAQAE